MQDRCFEVRGINMVATGEHIRKLREDNGFTVKDLQKVFGLEQPQAIYKWQKGMCLPDMEKMIVLSNMFHTTINEILVV